MSIDIGYGIDVLPEDDPFIVATELANKGLAVAGAPGAFWVDSFPIRECLSLHSYFCDRATVPNTLDHCVVKYVPSWVPGAGFKNKAKVWKQSTDQMVNGPFDKMKELAVSRTPRRLQDKVH